MKRRNSAGCFLLLFGVLLIAFAAFFTFGMAREQRSMRFSVEPVKAMEE